MELTFEKQNNFYVSEFQITSDANLHIEKSTGKLQLFQRTIGAGDYAEIKDFDTSDYDSDKIIDIDFQALVYPKWIKIKSAVKPLIATITTDGEVNEVVYQAKEIEITSNGTTKVTADTGYTALGSVNVKVNVPTEGGGESMKFYNVSQLTASNDYSKITPIFMCGMLLKLNISGIIIIATGSVLAEDPSFAEGIIAIGVDLSQKMINPSGEYSFADIISPILSEITEITKEEFYAMPKSYNIRFTRDEADENWVANEDLALFFEEAYAYLKANVGEEGYIQLMPYPIASVSYAYGDDEPFTIRIPRGAQWYEQALEDGLIRQSIQLDDTAHVFMKDIYPDGTIKYIFEILS